MKTPPAAATAILLIAGIAAAHRLPLPFHPLWLWPILIAMGGCAVFGLTGKLPAWVVIIMIVIMGWLRFSATHWRPARDIASLNGLPGITLKAHLDRDPSCLPGKTRIQLVADSVQTRKGFLSVQGRFLMTFYEDPPSPLPLYGDEIQVCGTLVTPAARRNPGGFDYRAYLSARKIGALMQTGRRMPVKITGNRKGRWLLRSFIYPVRRRISASLESIYQKPARGLMKALILGDRTGLDPDTREQFSQIGIVHVLAVSGLHVGFVLLILQTLAGLFRMPGRYATFFVIAGLVIYMGITENNPPVVRAAVMASIYIAGQSLERKSQPFNTLGTAAVLLLMINPLMLFDTGFQLSFAAVFSILWLTPRWSRLPGFSACGRWFRAHHMHGLWTLFLVSLSAQIGTLPVIVPVFHRIPLTGIVANLFAVPLTGLIVAYGFISLMAAAVHPWLAGIFGGCVTLLSRILVTSAEWMERHMEAVLYPSAPSAPVLLFYIILVVLIFSEHPALKRRLLFAGLMMLNVIVWAGAMQSKPGLTWVQLDVGQGDAAVIHLPRGRHVIIDGGDKTPWFDAGERILTPYLRYKGIRSIDAMILTHGHNDHVGGLYSVLENFRVRHIYLADTLTRSRPFTAFHKRARALQIPVSIITAPGTLQFPGTLLTFLAPDSVLQKSQNSNNRSLVTLFTFGPHRFLGMGDAEKPVEIRLLKHTRGLRADVVKIGHHGSSTSSSATFLKTIRPSFAVISVAQKNKFNHPSASTLVTLKDLDVPFFRTDREGAVIFHSDGFRLEKVAWK